MDKKALLKLADTLERAASELRLMARGIDGAQTERAQAEGIPSDLVEQLKVMGRDASAQRLSSMTQKQLGETFTQTGGAARDKGKSKDWLAERILWNLFDFESAHNIIKS